MITVRQQELDIDVQEELQPFLDQFDKAIVRDDKLQSCSPFRDDSHPSFAVHLENGSWIDSGATDHYRKGHFIQLLSFLRNEMPEDTADYLLDKYSVIKLDTNSLSLDMSWLHPKPQPKIFFAEDLRQYAFRHSYLSKRGISEEVQQFFRIGYDQQNKAVVMPWTDTEGHVINLKFRAVNSKRFWYAKEGQRVKYYLYGLYQAEQQKFKEVWLCESEIDCLKLWTNGIPAIACGTASMSKSQEQLLLTSCIDTVVIAVDNDKAGKQFKQNLVNRLTGKLQLKEIQFPAADIKDIGDMAEEQLKKCAETVDTVRIQVNI